MKRSKKNPAGNYMFKVNIRDTKAKVWNIFKVNDKATKFTPCSSVSINFEQVNARWEAVFTDISQAFDALITISQ